MQFLLKLQLNFTVRNAFNPLHQTAWQKGGIYPFLSGGLTIVCKGQLISEQICGVLNFQKRNDIIARISALASKMSQIIEMMAHYHAN